MDSTGFDGLGGPSYVLIHNLSPLLTPSIPRRRLSHLVDVLIERGLGGGELDDADAAAGLPEGAFKRVDDDQVGESGSGFKY